VGFTFLGGSLWLLILILILIVILIRMNRLPDHEKPGVYQAKSDYRLHEGD
jgi:hypothetical protein